MHELYTLDLSDTDWVRNLFTEYPSGLIIEAKVCAEEPWRWEDLGDLFGEVEYVSRRDRASFDPVHWTRLDDMDNGTRVYWRPHPEDDNHRETINIINRVHYGEMQITSVQVQLSTVHDTDITIGESSHLGMCFIPEFGQDPGAIDDTVRDHEMVQDALDNCAVSHLMSIAACADNAINNLKS